MYNFEKQKSIINILLMYFDTCIIGNCYFILLYFVDIFKNQVKNKAHGGGWSHCTKDWNDLWKPTWNVLSSQDKNWSDFIGFF